VRTCVLALGRAQRDHGCAVAARCVDGPPPCDDGEEAGQPFPVVASPAVVRAPLYLSPAAERWAESRAAGEFDVLHQHGIWTAMSRVTTRWRQAHGRPTVIAPHGSLEAVPLTYSRWKKRLAMLWYERENLARASCLHATAEEEVDGFRNFGLRCPVAVIPNGVDDAATVARGDADRFRRTHRIPRGARLLLYLSRIHPKKGLSDLVDGMALLGDRVGPWHLVIAGPEEDGAYVAAVRALVERRGLAARVHWLGPLYDDAKHDALAAAELFVLPTLSDNYAIVIAEALNAGVPVLTTQGALPWHVLEARGCGWWVPVGAASMAEALTRATALSGAALAAIGQRGVAVARAQCRWSDAAARTLELYHWLLGEAARPDFVVVK
jgi:glycosyltransferase involved in cell wall biosynthesis